ncbi:hypothetical protein EB796_023723 [Bugula neritina]|uniref:Uncharacterized protein n=1 Tax=Bugula neritina TaxID=10212 RepID=A0A7J7IVM4_BUGNE|nr:hypothetical protein EB796_023723 [Bugula neritina]
MNRDLGLSMTANGKTGVAIICLATGLFILYYTTAVQQSSIPYIAKSVSPIGNEYISSAENNSLVGKLLIVTEAIIKSDLKWSRGESNTLLKDAFNEMSNIFETLGHTNQLKQLQESLVSVSQPVKNSDVCQENYVKKDVAKSDPKYIFYRRIGFYQDNCTDVPPFHSLLTLVYNFVHYDSKYHSYIPELLHEANNLYTNLPILAAIPENFSIHDKDFRNTTLIRMNASMAEPDIWNSLVTKVKTKYVYIGRNVIKFTWHDRLERLVREINNLEASVVASSYRTLQSGVWSNGCEQSKLYNYILEYRSGYKTSKEECLVCHHVQRTICNSYSPTATDSI